jgi:hypothetical protein
MSTKSRNGWIMPAPSLPADLLRGGMPLLRPPLLSINHPPNKINMLTGRGSDPVRHLLGPHLASTSPPNGGKSDWHAHAVKSRPTTSAAELCSPRMVVVRHGRGWQATSPSARINFRTSSGPTCSPPGSSAACSRRYPEVPSEASNKALILILSSSRRWVWALWPLPPLSQKTQRNWISFKFTENSEKLNSFGCIWSSPTDSDPRINNEFITLLALGTRDIWLPQSGNSPLYQLTV